MKISAILYAIVIIAFFMPFFMVSCEKQELMTISGIQLVTGGEAPLNMKELMGATNAEDGQEEKKQKIEAQPTAIAAFVLAIIGIIVALMLPRKMYYIPVLISIVGIVCLHILKQGMLGALAKADTGMDPAFDMSKILTIHVKAGFWLADIAFLLGAIASLVLGIKREPEAVFTPFQSLEPTLNPDQDTTYDYNPQDDAEEMERATWDPMKRDSEENNNPDNT
ncbi:MAG: hypothetical protein PHO32_07520 [Candidatus Cloacimonetes bacterium]|nr:hypothetical protein [Candidatus Cloacimonadota bacterium]